MTVLCIFLLKSVRVGGEGRRQKDQDSSLKAAVLVVEGLRIEIADGACRVGLTPGRYGKPSLVDSGRWLGLAACGEVGVDLSVLRSSGC